jgi:hypothetical protein
MRAVGVVALNLAVGRTIFAFEPWRLAGIGPIAVTIQAGLLFLVRARGRPRRYAFWAGYEAGSVLGLWSFLYVRVPESAVGSLWEDYGAFIDGLIRAHYGTSVLNRGPLDSVLLITVAVFAFLPQFLIGLGAGLLSLSLAWSKRCRALTFTLFAALGFLIFHLAAWIAAWKALPAQPPWLLYGVTPAGLMLELGLLGLIRSWTRPRASAFWVGFLAVGSLVFWSYLRAMIFTELPTARYLTYWPNGPWYARPTPESPMWELWIDYTAIASYSLGRPPYGTYIVEWTNNWIDSVAYALIVFVPHLLSAMAGGALALRVVVISQRWFDHRSADSEVADPAHAGSANP